MIRDCNGLYTILDTWHSGDGVILLVSLSVWVTFISDMQCMPNPVVLFVSYGATPTVCDISYSIFSNLFVQTFYWFYASHDSDKQYDNFWVVISLASPLSHSSNLTGCSFNRFALVLSVKKRWRCHWCSLSKLIQPVNLCWLASMNPVGWYGWETAAALLHPFSLKQFTSFLRHQYSASTKYFVPISGWQDLYIWNKYSSSVLFPQSRSRDWERST